MNNAILSFPEIQIVRHARAKRLKLTVSAKGIRLTIPPFTSQHHVDGFVQQNQNWLKQMWAKHRQLLEHKREVVILPDQLQLCYLKSPIIIRYQSMCKILQFDAEQQQLWINQSCAEYALTQFVVQQAKLFLPPQLLGYASQNDLQVNQIRIATPTTRWGSCSHAQDIMLHAGLLLMPQQYADYVLYHELAHTQHMHHQARFWQLLEQLYPNAKQIQRQVKQFHLPHWWQVKKIK